MGEWHVFDYMPWNEDDYNKAEGVLPLTDRQDVWYRRLLWFQWRKAGIPDDDFLWYAIARPEQGVGPENPEWLRFAEMVPRLFNIVQHGRRFNKRNLAEHQRQTSIVEGKRAGGKRSADIRRRKADISKNGASDNIPQSNLQDTLGTHEQGGGEGLATTSVLPSEVPAVPVVENSTTFGDCMGAIRSRWALSETEMTRQGSQLKALQATGKEFEDIRRAIIGLALLHADGIVRPAPHMGLLYNADMSQPVPLYRRALARYDEHIEERPRRSRASCEPTAVTEMLRGTG